MLNETGSAEAWARSNVIIAVITARMRTPITFERLHMDAPL
jgi:hypothetical protein